MTKAAQTADSAEPQGPESQSTISKDDPTVARMERRAAQPDNSFLIPVKLDEVGSLLSVLNAAIQKSGYDPVSRIAMQFGGRLEAAAMSHQQRLSATTSGNGRS